MIFWKTYNFQGNGSGDMCAIWLGQTERHVSTLLASIRLEHRQLPSEFRYILRNHVIISKYGDTKTNTSVASFVGNKV
jgi:hypothetical protein